MNRRLPLLWGSRLYTFIPIKGDSHTGYSLTVEMSTRLLTMA